MKVGDIRYNKLSDHWVKIIEITGTSALVRTGYSTAEYSVALANLITADQHLYTLFSDFSSEDYYTDSKGVCYSYQYSLAADEHVFENVVTKTPLIVRDTTTLQLLTI